MSTKQLTRREQATFLLGKAVMRQLEEAPRDPATVRELEALANWVAHWLTAEERDTVMVETGYFVPDIDEPTLEEPASRRDDSDVPF